MMDGSAGSGAPVLIDAGAGRRYGVIATFSTPWRRSLNRA